MIDKKLHLKWATAAAVVAVVVGSSTYYATITAKIRAEALKEAKVQRVIDEHDPLMDRVQANATTTIQNTARISTLESSVASLITSQHETNAKLDRLIALIIEDRYRRQRP